MKSFVIDCETIPQCAEILQAKMPEELRNPVMPENIANPEPPNWSEACPKYASIKDPTDRAAKMITWVREKEEKWKASTQDARQKWELGIVERKTKFTQDAALDARLGHAKLIGIKDVEADISTVFVWENDITQLSRILAWTRDRKDGADELGKIVVRAHKEEGAMLKAFFAAFKDAMEPDPFNDPSASFTERNAQCVTYYGNTFDFPFLYRRAWMLGIPQPPLYRRGRYWDDRMVDLRDSWIMGDRNESSGGLDNMAAALGYDRAKLHDGASFHKFYQEDPSEGLAYLLNDLEATAFSGRKMGIIW